MDLTFCKIYIFLFPYINIVDVTQIIFCLFVCLSKKCDFMEVLNMLKTLCYLR